MQKQKHHHNKHRPVLAEQVLNVLSPKLGESYLDLTAGHGGHAELILARTQKPDQMVLVDRDESAIDSLKEFERLGAKVIRKDYYQATLELTKAKRQFDMVLLDLGVSSPQLDIPERGFSFRSDAPLDMRMDRRQEIDASKLINSLTQRELADLIFRYGEERNANRYAEAITRHRPINSTLELANVIKDASNKSWGRIHPATRTFQALRIAVNDELGQLENTLPLLINILADGGRLAVISFHSLEDRLVKRYLRDEALSGYESRLELLTKRPLSGAKYDVNNPRARSAKLRAAVKKQKTERSDNADKGRI